MLRFLFRLFRRQAPHQHAEVHCLTCARREAARLPVRSSRTERARARGRRPLPHCSACAPPPARRPRRRQPVALSLALGACLALLAVVALQPLHVPHELHQAQPVVAGELPDAGPSLEDVATVDVSTDAGQPFWMGSRPVPLRIPQAKDAPEKWKRAPCGESEREINGLCFVNLEARPRRDGTCAHGLPYEGRCVSPVTAEKRLPASIER
jgi:hypothetical protein